MDDDILISCLCGKEFIWSSEEQKFYREKGFDAPKRCPECRKLKKARDLASTQERDSQDVTEFYEDDAHPRKKEVVPCCVGMQGLARSRAVFSVGGVAKLSIPGGAVVDIMYCPFCSQEIEN